MAEETDVKTAKNGKSPIVMILVVLVILLLLASTLLIIGGEHLLSTQG